MADERKLDEIDFSKGEGYEVNGVLVDAEGRPVKGKADAEPVSGSGSGADVPDDADKDKPQDAPTVAPKPDAHILPAPASRARPGN